MSAEPITPYACSRGLVIAHQDEPPAYIVRTPSGQVEGFPANGAPSPEAVEADLANPPAPVLPVPAEVSRARFLIALRRCFGLNEGAIYALISQLPAGDEQEDARDIFENAIEFRRANAFLATLAAAAGKSSADLDNLFRFAAALDLGD